MSGIIVQAADIEKVLSARFDKAVADFFVDFFQRFDAIGGKGRRNHRDIGLTFFFCQSRHLFHRIGL